MPANTIVPGMSANAFNVRLLASRPSSSSKSTRECYFEYILWPENIILTIRLACALQSIKVGLPAHIAEMSARGRTASKYSRSNFNRTISRSLVRLFTDSTISAVVSLRGGNPRRVGTAALRRSKQPRAAVLGIVGYRTGTITRFPLGEPVLSSSNDSRDRVGRRHDASDRRVELNLRDAILIGARLKISK